MPSYTVHAPPPRKDGTASGPERFRFVRDGFSVWAFLIPPLWLVLYRLWLALLVYMAGYGLIAAGLRFLSAPWSAQLAVTLLIGLLLGLEASSIERWTLARRGWKTLGVVVAPDEEMAEQRFIAEWSKGSASHTDEQLTAPPPAPQGFTAPMRHGPPSGEHVIGLFPEPGGSR